jgi:phosphatidylglycerophosphate synthase
MSRPFGRLLLSLSLSRIALGFLVLITYKAGDVALASYSIIIICAAQMTDHLDGFIARKYSTPTINGYLQDSLGDKIFQFSVLLSVSREHDIDPTILWCYFFREVLVLSIRIAAQFDHKTLHSLRGYSILYAIPMRLGSIIAVASSIIAPLLGVHVDILIITSILMMVIAFIPATAGIIISLRYMK